MIWNLIESRKAGASARRVLWLAFWGERARGYATAVRMNIPEDEAVAAVRRGISLSDYIRAREAASHTETLEAHAAAGDLFEYTWQRGSGRGHLPAMEAAEGKPFSANERVEIEAAPDAGARESLREDRSRTPLEEKVFAEVPIGAVYEHQPN